MRALTQTSECDPVRSTFYVVSCLLHIIRSKNSPTPQPNANLIAMETIVVHVHQVNKVLNGKMHKIFLSNETSVFCLKCSCFLGAVQTRVGSNQPTQI